MYLISIFLLIFISPLLKFALCAGSINNILGCIVSKKQYYPNITEILNDRDKLNLLHWVAYTFVLLYTRSTLILTKLVNIACGVFMFTVGLLLF